MSSSDDTQSEQGGASAGNQGAQGGSEGPGAQASQPGTPTQPAQQESLGDIVGKPVVKQYVKAQAILFAGIGVGVGVLVFLFGGYGSEAIAEIGASSPNLSADQIEARAKMFQVGIINLSLIGVQLLPIFVAPILGAFVGTRIDSAGSRTPVVAAGLGALVGTFLLVVVGGFLAGLQFPTFGSTPAASSRGVYGILVGATSLEVEFGGLIKNAILVAIAAGVASSIAGYAGDQIR